ncbi:MAG TPA: histidine kinase [Planctomycetota bacterium]|nr:histidine kinase [Planctomycetota bacterium]
MRSWALYVLAWALAAGLWTLAAASGAHRPPIEALPAGLGLMAFAAALGVGVIRLTARVPLSTPRARFVAVHAVALAIFAFLYPFGLVWPDFFRGRALEGLGTLRHSPIFWWNVLMGSWLYLLVAGIAYAVRAHRAAVEASLVAKQAQLAALRAQLNPHFLFNALNTVSSLMASDARAADEALERLGHLLRYALADDEEVPLASEWAFTRDYLELEKLRFGERLRTEAHLDPAAMRVLVPALFLQPIVENAVRHGVDARPDGGRVVLSASVEGERLVCRVVDDGPGAAPASEGRGLGLRAVRRRLEAAKGELDVGRGSNDAGWAVTISLPAGRARA